MTIKSDFSDIISAKWENREKIYHAISSCVELGYLRLSPVLNTRTDLDAYDAQLFDKKNVFYIDSLFVYTEYRGSGLGKALLHAAIKWAKRSHKILILDSIPLENDMDKFRLYRFYLDAGFEFSTRRLTDEDHTGMIFHSCKEVS